MKKLKLFNFIPIIITAPAIVIGTIAMYYNRISNFVIIQNIIGLVIMGLISYYLLSRNINICRNKNIKDIFKLIPLILLLFTFIGEGMMGVHRWISIGPIRLNIAMIVMPIIILSLWKLLKNNSWWKVAIITIFISIVLFIQPDASQLSGFAIPMIFMLYKNGDKRIFSTIISLALFILVILSWIHLDNLSPVSYVEEILNLVDNVGQVWFLLGIVSLVILPTPFILLPPEKLKLPSICIGLYFSIIIISTFFGNFPVPLMGYGISPIIGYIISITWYTKLKFN
ncbi:cell division protein [Clostridium senegalense]